MSHAQYTPMLSATLQRWLRRQSRPLPEPWRDAALVLLRLNLEPARPLLAPLYAPGPRGRPPYDPLCMLRALLLMLLLHYKSIPQWAHDLRRHPRLAQIAGLPPFHTPAAAAFYAFMAHDPQWAVPPCLTDVYPARLVTWPFSAVKKNFISETPQRGDKRIKERFGVPYTPCIPLCSSSYWRDKGETGHGWEEKKLDMTWGAWP